MAVAIIGVGNILMRDEGVGVRIIEELQKRGLPKGIDVFDAGIWIMDLIPDLESYDRWIIVDAVRGGSRSATLYRFRPDDLEQSPFGVKDSLSLHQFSLLESLAMDHLLSAKRHDVTIIGIEPEVIDLGMELSSNIRERVPYFADFVLKEALKGSKEDFT